MCLYPKLILNRKYCPTKKNGWNPPECKDDRTRYVTAACGHCYECRKQKARQWTVRICEEMRVNRNALFVTLTITDEHYEKIKEKIKETDDNKIAGHAIRLFLERIRKKDGKSRKHWFITEKGHEGTKRVHLHGIIWGENIRELVKTKWNYGHIFIGDYVTEKTALYITKYMCKEDKENDGFIGKVFCSKGIGENYINRVDSENNRYKPNGRTNETYKTRSGIKLNLPVYYRNKLLSEDERELLFIEKIEKGIVFVCGDEVNADDYKGYTNLLAYHRDKARRVFGDTQIEWEEKKYKKRLQKQRRYYKQENERLESDNTNDCGADYENRKS